MLPIFDNSHELYTVGDSILAAISDVLRSGRYILGTRVASFEQALAAWLHVEHAVGVASGTDALYLALAALGIGPGDEVITSPFTFMATAQAIVRTGATPVFADIDPSTFNLDPVPVEAAVTARTAAVVVVHLFGQPCAMDTFADLAARRGLAVVEDVAQALGSRWQDKRAGTFGDAAAVSFFPTKPLGAAGDGGALLTGNESVAGIVRRLRVHGAAEKYLHTDIGINSRLDELQAAILNVKLPHLDGWNRARREVADWYGSELPTQACIPPRVAAGAESVFSQYTVRVLGERDALRDSLHEAGIGTAVHYPRPLHLQPALSGLRHRDGDFPNAEQACREVLSLPCHPGMRYTDVSRVAEVVVRWQTRRRGEGRS